MLDFAHDDHQYWVTEQFILLKLFYQHLSHHLEELFFFLGLVAFLAFAFLMQNEYTLSFYKIKASLQSSFECLYVYGIYLFFQVMKFFLLDWSWFLYRAYYAFPPFMDADGHNMNVVYGFVRMILKIIAEKPDYFVIAWDSPVKTHRHEMYEDYKATRKKMEDDFKYQIPFVIELVEKLWIPHLVSPWFEADDILASLVAAYKHEADLSLYVYSADKDLKQLVWPNTYCVEPMKQTISTVENFTKEFGFAPQHIVDYLSLLWDASDNIPGVAGFGPKKASDLICKYWDIENIYAHINELSRDIQEKLIAGQEDALFSKELIKLHIIPELLDKDINSYTLDPDFPKRRDILIKDYGFSSMNKLLDDLKKKFSMPVQSSLF